MKRKIASRKLKRRCELCGKGFRKGEVYYKRRVVAVFDTAIYATEYLLCPRCEECGNRMEESVFED